eukprot:CAMPEP_0118695910 /NCGR_PEP_ID=MMETSP0800-20121206/13498_1 /TAXON_ID=210618 ORGANISM="Striatella unipunctata, Strain CCMP2910" /NCGR_SAMPLE_ID=MMETSP0800 /ASSEMBLY_ACC=CAM_ASM_000638 /LENGTH=145 /DNA_ID=CAMNT_0006594853 /DNA_START=239 /DNA_END=676 /DNA_ORIENTATION=-
MAMNFREKGHLDPPASLKTGHHEHFPVSDMGTLITPPSEESSAHDLSTSPLTSSSFHVMAREYDQDTWRMYNRITMAKTYTEGSTVPQPGNFGPSFGGINEVKSTSAAFFEDERKFIQNCDDNDEEDDSNEEEEDGDIFELDMDL